MAVPVRSASAAPAALDDSGSFVARHIGPSSDEVASMLGTLGYATLDALIDATIPASIRFRRGLALPPAESEYDALTRLKGIAAKNEVFTSYLGQGYYGTIVPAVIQRTVLENPGWYTAYTPYQAEIAQGRLEALLNFQTMVTDLTGLPIANASLLDEATSAAEAVALSHAAVSGERTHFFVTADCHPQTIAVVQTRAEARGWTVVTGDAQSFEFTPQYFGALIQYPTTDGAVVDYTAFCERAHAAGALVTAATDLMALALLTPPGEWGADIAVGSAQRFGVPMGYGGPHAAFFATRDEFKRLLPGRIIGVSRDSHGQPALRMALQTREQHIRREKATSNVCTAQVLLSVMASMYGVYHGPAGITRIARRIQRLTATFVAGLETLGLQVLHEHYFDTVRVEVGVHGVQDIMAAAAAHRVNLRQLSEGSLGVSLDETTSLADVATLLAIFSGMKATELDIDVTELAAATTPRYDERFARTSPFMTHPVFNTHHSETAMLRYIKQLEAKDLSLCHSMIALGSCTMKLNAATEMYPVTWAEFGNLHPFAPRAQAAGYAQMFTELEAALADITGFAAVSLQPNAGSQGEYAGLLTIRRYHQAQGNGHRTICLIPASAHGTNPASAAMCGMTIVPVKTAPNGNIDVDDLKAKAAEHAANLACLMVTYPSTHGVFEESIADICATIHAHGGQVYMDGANMNAMVGVCRPGDIGADVCHLNLHKTFCIPHGGGGPGMGPIGVAAHLAPHLPGHAPAGLGTEASAGAVSAAPYGSASILPISYLYIRMMGAEGLAYATKVAILNANYVAKRLAHAYPVLYQGPNGTVAHECIVDPRPLKASAGIEVEDITKRLMDYGFHAPTVSFPVAGTLMIEPTESEDKAELDRFCDAMLSIREEIAQVERGELPRDDNPLKHAPHTASAVISDAWTHAYPREQAAFPTPHVRAAKFWPTVGRIESAFGDRNLVCTCPPMEAYAEA
ncbi:MAG: aminomethyl-transferring glycine dehydrogenase [Gemmatimonadaceae bacterium]|nr:aminomethyl-transferring glycine dehydrogenase [Gemmatimonadaceae bacterium]